MTTITDTLRTCHAIVWTARAELEPYWPTPDVHHSLAFAACEAAEALDARLRMLPQYARNRDKDLSVDAELCDCLMMLLTAIGKDADVLIDDIIDDWSEAPEGIEHLVWSCGEMAAFYGTHGYEYGYPGKLWFCASDIVLMVGPGVAEVLTARLDRIKAKRLPLATIAISDAYEQRKVAHESEAP